MHALDAVIFCLQNQAHTYEWEGFSRREADSAREYLVQEVNRVRYLLHDDIIRGDA
jgi:hypothetical protein